MRSVGFQTVTAFFITAMKKCFIRRTNPASHLKTSGFDIKLFWSRIPSGIFAGIQNDASKIRRNNEKTSIAAGGFNPYGLSGRCEKSSGA